MQARLQRWRSFVAMGLIVAPFLPASNLFFWVRGARSAARMPFRPVPLVPLQHEVGGRKEGRSQHSSRLGLIRWIIMNHV